MAMSFPPEVERWRSLVAKYFPPKEVDKALWVIQWESGGRPDAIGDGGAARGLFQIQDSRNFSNRPDAAYLDNPENNIRYAAQELGAAGGNWGAWGEGTTYNGKVFGALGNHPFPGSNAGGSYPAPPATGGGMNYNPDIYKQLQDNAEQAWQDWIDAGMPGEDSDDEGYAIYSAYQTAVGALSDFQSTYGIDPRKDGSGDANDAVNRWATIENIDIARAQQAYNNWKAANDMAFDAAEGEIKQVAERNAANVDLQEARNKSSTPGLLPRNMNAGYVEPKFSEALSKYKAKYGATDTPPALSGYATPPSTAPATGGGTPAGASKYPLAPSLGPTADSGRNPMDDIYTYSPSGDPRNANMNPPEGIQPGAADEGAPSYKPKDRFGLDDILGAASWIPGPVGGAANAARVGKKAGKWFTRRFAEGGVNIPGGPAWVGEKGPEIMVDALGNQTVVGKNGPEQIVIPDGSTIIPANEAFAMRRIKQGMGQPHSPAAADPNDPELQQKVMDSVRRAVAASYAMKPPTTPLPYGGATDYFASWRPLTGVQIPTEEGANATA